MSKKAEVKIRLAPSEWMSAGADLAPPITYTCDCRNDVTITRWGQPQGQ